jgi:hypothetical protein
MSNSKNHSKNNYIENLPEELIQNVCYVCYSKTNKHYDDNSKNKCIDCGKPVCKECWDGYMMNYYRGFRVGLKKCPDCTIEIIKKLQL